MSCPKTEDIYVMNADGSNQKVVIATDLNDFTPCWSPDGSMIAFQLTRVENGKQNNDICISSLSGKIYKIVTTNQGWDTHPSWH